MRKLRSEENSIYDIETKIMDAWNTISDIDLIYHAMETMDNEDDRMNAMLGLMSIGEIRFQNLWRVFEQYVAEQHRLSQVDV